VIILVLFLVIITIWFSLILLSRVGSKFYLEFGFWLSWFFVLYTTGPVIVYKTAAFSVGDPISYIFGDFVPMNEGLFINHVGRMVLFNVVFQMFYLLIRRNTRLQNVSKLKYTGTGTVFLLSFIVFTCYFILFIFSKESGGYIESYQRYDHLPRYFRLLISFIVRIKFGLCLLMTIYLIALGKTKPLLMTVFPLALLILIELIYGRGSRITLLILIIQLFALLILFGYRVSRRQLFISSLFLLFSFSLIEKLRVDDDSTKDIVLSVPGELGSVFFTSYHLYSQRAENVNFQTDWRMLFFDFYSPFLANASLRDIDPIYWYTERYFSYADVPPFTLGPIANSAIWEGHIGLVLRPLAMAIIFGGFMNYFSRHCWNLWRIYLFTALFSTLVMVPKYSVFYHTTPLIKNYIIPFVFIWLVFHLWKIRSPI